MCFGSEWQRADRRESDQPQLDRNIALPCPYSVRAHGNLPIIHCENKTRFLGTKANLFIISLWTLMAPHFTGKSCHQCLNTCLLAVPQRFYVFTNLTYIRYMYCMLVKTVNATIYITCMLKGPVCARLASSCCFFLAVHFAGNLKSSKNHI